MKICFKCGMKKSLDNFYSHPKMTDGHLNKCKECAKKDTALRAKLLSKNSEWMKKERARCREKSKLYRESGRAKLISYQQTNNWRKRNRVKSRAHTIAQRAHRIKPENCERCKLPAKILHRHHADYSKPKEIVWLCPKCHGIEHRIDKVADYVQAQLH